MPKDIWGYNVETRAPTSDLPPRTQALDGLSPDPLFKCLICESFITLIMLESHMKWHFAQANAPLSKADVESTS